MAEINNPVDLTAFATTIANNPRSKGTDWNLSCYNPLKAHIKQHYSIIQDDLCCYCKISLRFGGYGEPIEHIVPKDDRPRWMFEPKNLALSCYPCNTKKNADNTLSLSGRRSRVYPTTSSGFLIYQPHFNNWDTHFEIFRSYFLKPKTQKGRETFKVCELYRINLPLDKAKMKDISETSFRIRIISKVLLDPDSTNNIINQCQEISTEIIKRAKIKLQILANA